MTTFILASHNKKKMREMQDILGAMHIAVQEVPQDAPEPEENGKSFAENACIKARAACKLTEQTAIADDSGLCVDALDGAPGIYSARYCAGSDEDRVAFLLENLKDVPDEQRTARFVSAIAVVFPDGRECVVEGACEGVITRSVQGAGGFGYDPVFYVPEHGCTFGELPQDIKNQISHRANALKKLKEALMNVL